MTTISLKLPDTLDSRLAEEAQRRRTSKSAVVRDCVEKVLLAPRKDRAASCLDLASDLAGCLKGHVTSPQTRNTSKTSASE